MNTTASHPAMIVEGLTVRSPDRTILNDISFQLERNDILGLIGETGSGKSVLIDALGMNTAPGLEGESRTLSYIDGDQTIRLRDFSQDALQDKIWGKKIAFILSNARSRFNPIMTVGAQFEDILMSNSGMKRNEAVERSIEMFKRVQMPDPLRNRGNYPHELSGGMIQRVEIAIALAMSPRFLLMDEPTMGLDVTVQRQTLDLMDGLFKTLKTTAVLATRDMGIVANYCTKIAVLYHGQIAEFAEIKQFFKNPQHPYSKYLLDIAFASNNKNIERRKRVTLAHGAENAMKGCFCTDFCENVGAECMTTRPPVIERERGHSVRCHKVKSKAGSAS